MALSVECGVCVRRALHLGALAACSLRQGSSRLGAATARRRQQQSLAQRARKMRGAAAQPYGESNRQLFERAALLGQPKTQSALRTLRLDGDARGRYCICNKLY